MRQFCSLTVPWRYIEKALFDMLRVCDEVTVYHKKHDGMERYILTGSYAGTPEKYIQAEREWNELATREHWDIPGIAFFARQIKKGKADESTGI